MARFFLSVGILFCFFSADAQVGRKGVTPVQRGAHVNSSQKAADFSLSQLQGKWQEYKREDKDNSPVDFTDSIQLKFTDTNKVQTRTSISTSMTMNGLAAIDGDNNLTVAADVYTIKSLSDNELVLDDNDKYLHHLKKVVDYWYEMLGKESVKQDTYTDSVKVALSGILAKWSVYKRQAKPGAITPSMQLIKYLNITAKASDNSATGDITFYQGQSSQQFPCTVTLSGSKIKIVAGQNTWDFTVFQSDGDNFIFGNDGLLYFSKAEH